MTKEVFATAKEARLTLWFRDQAAIIASADPEPGIEGLPCSQQPQQGILDLDGRPATSATCRHRHVAGRPTDSPVCIAGHN